MFGNIMEPLRPKAAASPQRSFDGIAGILEQRERIRETIATCDILSRRGLWGMLIFIGISALALQLRGVDIFSGLPETIRILLGAAPSPVLVHIVLAVSSVSSLIIVLGRQTDEPPTSTGWGSLCSSLCFRSIFYLFYAFSNTLEQNYLYVFIAGMIVLMVEHFATWRAAVKTIREKKELLGLLR